MLDVTLGSFHIFDREDPQDLKPDVVAWVRGCRGCRWGCRRLQVGLQRLQRLLRWLTLTLEFNQAFRHLPLPAPKHNKGPRAPSGGP